MIKRLLQLSLVIIFVSLFAHSQVPSYIAPDCSVGFSYTVTASTVTNPASGTAFNSASRTVRDNRWGSSSPSGGSCTTWTVYTWSTGVTAYSGEIDNAPDASAQPGSWSTWSGTPAITSPTDTVSASGFFPWVSFNLNSATGTGQITGVIIGWRQQGASPGTVVSNSSLTSTTCPGTGCISVPTSGSSSVAVEITGTWTGSLSFQVTIDGTTWSNVNMGIEAGTFAANGSQQSTTTLNGKFAAPVGGISRFRVLATALTSGTAVVTVSVSPGQSPFQYSVLTSPGSPMTAPWYSTFTPNTRLRVSGEPDNLFSDNFDGGTIDTTDRWNSAVLAGTGTVTQTGGALVFATGTTASNIASIATQVTFAPFTTNFFIFILPVQLEAACIPGASRWWGPGSPNGGGVTATTPIQDGAGFEVDINCVFSASVYAGGTRVFQKVLIYPTDGNFHRYLIYGRADQFNWYVDTFDIPQAREQFISPQVQALPLRFAMVNNSAGAPASGPTFNVASIGYADSGQNETAIKDPVFGWRSANVTKDGGLQVTNEGRRTTYRAAVSFSPPAGGATDIFTITGSATKTVKVNRVGVSCTATAAIATDVAFLKRSTADTGGTSSATTAVPLDSANAAATATVLSYTVNPAVLGTLVGNLSVDKASITATTGAPQLYTEDWGLKSGTQYPVLRGVAQVIAVNLAGAVIAGLACAAEVEWTEE